MGPYKRNWFVGGTVLLGLITLACLIVMFGGSLGSFFAGEKIHIVFKGDRGDGISAGSIVRYLGQQVGTVKSIHLVLDETPNYVVIDAELDKEKPIPSNTTGSIRVLSVLGGSAVIELEVAPTADQTPKLHGGETLTLKYMANGVVPPEVSDLASEMTLAVHEFREANVIGSFKTAIDNFNAQVSKAGAVMASVNDVLGTKESQADLKTAIAQARQTIEHANAVAAEAEKMMADYKPKLDATVTDMQAGAADARKTIALAQERITTVTDQLNRNLDKIAGVLDDAHAISGKVNTGDGTLAKLLNDPKLYETIVTTTQVIEETVKDIQRVVRGIEQEGFPINLK